MSLRQTSYIAQSPQGSQKREMALFHLKLHFTLKKSATIFFVNTVSNKVVQHSFTSYLRWLVVDVPFNLKFWPKLTHPLQKCQLPINIQSIHLSGNT